MSHANYIIYDVETNIVYYVGMSKDPHTRFKQHQQKASWFRRLQSQGIPLSYSVVESGMSLQEARQREQHWIKTYANLGHPLENLNHNTDAHSEREHQEDLYNSLLEDFSQKHDRYTAYKLAEIHMVAFRKFGGDAWDSAYTAVKLTIKQLEKYPNFGLQLDAIDICKLTFKIFGEEWTDESEDEE